jgi:hypothetical protein
VKVHATPHFPYSLVKNSGTQRPTTERKKDTADKLDATCVGKATVMYMSAMSYTAC